MLVIYDFDIVLQLPWHGLHQALRGDPLVENILIGKSHSS
jgi:hypothetical protein